jgi:hypothetical protein
MGETELSRDWVRGKPISEMQSILVTEGVVANTYATHMKKRRELLTETMWQPVRMPGTFSARYVALMAAISYRRYEPVMSVASRRANAVANGGSWVEAGRVLTSFMILKSGKGKDRKGLKKTERFETGSRTVIAVCRIADRQFGMNRDFYVPLVTGSNEEQLKWQGTWCEPHRVERVRS